VRRAPSHVGFWVVVGAAAIFVIVGVVLPTIPVKGLTVRTVVETSEATTMAVYVNDLDAAAVSVPLAAGVDATTVLQLHSGGVDLIQLNFYGPVGEHIRLYSVQVLNGKRVLASSSGGDFSRWQMAFIYPTGQPARPSTSPSIVLATTEEGSALHETLDIPGPSSFPGAVEARDPLHRLSLSFWIGLGLGLSAWAMSRDRRSLAGVVIVAGIAVVGCLFLISQHTGGLTPAVSGVGRATYLGLSVASNLHAVEAMYALAAVLGFAAGLGCRRIRLLVDRFFRLQPAPGRTRGRSKRQRSRAAVSIGTSGDDTDRTPTRPTRYRVPSHLINGALLATALVAAVAVLTPDILSDLHSAAVQTYVPGLDNDNGLAWQVFAERGLVPMKDFWYPYGNSLFFVAHPVVGSVLQALFNLSLVGAFGWVFWCMSRRNRWVTWLAVIALLLAEQFMPEFSRYSVGYLVPLLYWTIPAEGPAHRWTGRVVLALAVGGGLFVEPDPVLYGCIGLALSLAVELLVEYRKAVHLLREIAVNLAAPLGLAVVYIVYTAAEGQLGGLWDIYGQVGAVTAYSAYPAVLVTNLRSALGLNGLVVWVPALMLGAGLFLRVRLRSQDVPVSRSLIALAGCGFPLLEKSVVRPIPDEIRITLGLAALVVLVTGCPVAFRPRGDGQGWLHHMRALAIGGCVGALAAAIVASPGPGVLRSGVRSLPTTLRDDVHVLLHRAEVRGLERQALAPARFADYQAEFQVASAVRDLIGHSRDGLFVLGDDPSLYVILDQNPPWTITAYNTSPISDQRRVVDWLADHKPQVVVLDEATPSYDEVPSDVRIPLVYQAIVAGYVPLAHVGSYAVLGRRPTGQGPDPGFWAGVLGTQVDLGFVPDAMRASVPGLGRVSSRVPYLSVQRDGPSGGEATVSVPVQFGSVDIEITLNAQPGRDEFSIPLSRVWAWALSHNPTVTGFASPGWTAHIAFGTLPTDQLY
jgi:hypothetical protein